MYYSDPAPRERKSRRAERIRQQGRPRSSGVRRNMEPERVGAGSRRRRPHGYQRRHGDLGEGASVPGGSHRRGTTGGLRRAAREPPGRPCEACGGGRALGLPQRHHVGREGEREKGGCGGDAGGGEATSGTVGGFVRRGGESEERGTGFWVGCWRMRVLGAGSFYCV